MCRGIIYASVFILLCATICFDEHQFSTRLFFPKCVLGLSKSTVHKNVKLWLSLKSYSIDNHACFYANTYRIFIIIALQYNLKCNGNNSSSGFIDQDCFSCPSLFVFPNKGEDLKKISVKNCFGILNGIALNL